jgi:hypothetical protein
MLLDDLPRDVLLLIADWLLLRDIQSFALTFNKQVTAIYMPQLKDLCEYPQNPRRSIRVSKASGFFLNLSDSSIDESKGEFDIPVSAKLLPYAERLKRVDHIELDSTLEWLRFMGKDRPCDLFAADNYTVPTQEVINNLQEDATALGITLSVAFMKLSTDPKITNASQIKRRDVNEGDLCFRLPPPPRGTFSKVSVSVNRDAGGHFFLFAGISG